MKSILLLLSLFLSNSVFANNCVVYFERHDREINCVECDESFYNYFDRQVTRELIKLGYTVTSDKYQKNLLVLKRTSTLSMYREEMMRVSVELTDTVSGQKWNTNGNSKLCHGHKCENRAMKRAVAQLPFCTQTDRI